MNTNAADLAAGTLVKVRRTGVVMVDRVEHVEWSDTDYVVGRRLMHYGTPQQRTGQEEKWYPAASVVEMVAAA